MGQVTAVEVAKSALELLEKALSVRNLSTSAEAPPGVRPLIVEMPLYPTEKDIELGISEFADLIVLPAVQQMAGRIAQEFGPDTKYAAFLAQTQPGGMIWSQLAENPKTGVRLRLLRDYSLHTNRFETWIFAALVLV
jgi:hypothetical protein